MSSDGNPPRPSEEAARSEEADRVALGWARAERGPLGRILERIGRQPRRAWRLSARLLRQGRAEIGRRSLAKIRARALADPARSLRLVRRLPKGRLRAEAEALLVARTRGWEAAAPLFERLAAGGRAAPGPGGAAFLLRPRPPVPALDLAVPVRDRSVDIPAALAARIVVYTACFGREPLLPPLLDTGGVRFLCFTDATISVPGWELRPAASGAPGSPRAAEAFHKIRAGTVLAEAAPEAEFSLWLDPETRLIGNLHTLVTRWLDRHDLALWRHPACIDWHDLAEHGLLAGGEPGPLLAQAAAAAREAAPRDRGAVDTRFLWRRHRAEAVEALADCWWRLEEPAPGADAISLYRVLHGRDGVAIRPTVLPQALGSAADNAFSAHAPRQGLARPPRLPAPAPAGSGPAAPALPRGRVPIAFVYAKAHAKTATTFLRGEQLSGLVAAAYPDRFDVTYTHDADSVRDQVVIVTKSMLSTRSAEEIAAIRARNILAIGSWDDVMPEPAHVAALDAHMTLSIRQTLALNRRFPATPAFLVTHHVSTQVRPSRPPQDRLRTAYFGDLANTERPESLARMVDLVGTNTARVNDSWLDALPHYNCHWIVRRWQPWNGWKPFLKGFVAARCGAVLVVTRDDGDALHYLGDDYPFYAPSLAHADLEMTMARVAAAFGGPEWRLALDIMRQVEARSTDAQVCADFRAMIEALIR